MEEIKSAMAVTNDGPTPIDVEIIQVDGMPTAVRHIEYGEKVRVQPGERAVFYHRPDCAYFTNE